MRRQAEAMARAAPPDPHRRLSGELPRSPEETTLNPPPPASLSSTASSTASAASSVGSGNMPRPMTHADRLEKHGKRLSMPPTSAEIFAMRFGMLAKAEAEEREKKERDMKAAKAKAKAAAKALSPKDMLMVTNPSLERMPPPGGRPRSDDIFAAPPVHAITALPLPPKEREKGKDRERDRSKTGSPLKEIGQDPAAAGQPLEQKKKHRLFFFASSEKVQQQREAEKEEERHRAELLVKRRSLPAYPLASATQQPSPLQVSTVAGASTTPPSTLLQSPNQPQYAVVPESASIRGRSSHSNPRLLTAALRSGSPASRSSSPQRSPPSLPPLPDSSAANAETATTNPQRTPKEGELSSSSEEIGEHSRRHHRHKHSRGRGSFDSALRPDDVDAAAAASASSYAAPEKASSSGKSRRHHRTSSRSSSRDVSPDRGSGAGTPTSGMGLGLPPGVKPLDLSKVGTAASVTATSSAAGNGPQTATLGTGTVADERPLTVRDIKNYFANVLPDATDAEICEYVETDQGVVERELADNEPVANNPQKIFVRNASSLRITPPPGVRVNGPAPQKTVAPRLVVVAPPPQMEKQPQQSQSLSTAAAQPASPKPMAPPVTVTVTAAPQEPPLTGPEALENPREDPRKVLKRQPSRFVMPFSEAQPYKLKKDTAELSLALVQVEHVRKGTHSRWTLAIDPQCTAADLCIAVLEMDMSVPPESIDPANVPATLYEVDRPKQPSSSQPLQSLSPQPAGGPFDPTAPGVELVVMNELVLARTAQWGLPKDHFFVVLDDPRLKRLSMTPGTVKKQNVPIVVDMDAEVGAVGEQSYWIREDEIQWLSKISSGTFARVYKGMFRGQLVAVKMLKGKLDEKIIKEFRQEFRVLKAVKHENLIASFGVCFEHNRLSYVMEYAQRGTLVHLMMDPNVQFSWANVVDFLKQACRGLRFLHEECRPEIIHRDLKSMNLLVMRDYVVKLGDFGLSRFNTVSNGTTLGNLCGTMSHAAPEVFNGEKFTAKSDIYSLGMILWELANRTATGEYSPPYKEFPYIHLDIQIIIQASQKNLRPTIPALCPERIAKLIRWCWDKDVASRPKASEVLDSIKDLESQRMGSQTPTTPSPDRQLTPPSLSPNVSPTQPRAHQQDTTPNVQH